MTGIRAAVLAVAIATAGSALAGVAFAGKGKPGGTPPPPAVGTIYFGDVATGDVQAYTMTFGSMDGTGGNRATLAHMSSIGTRPSRRLHGGKRWFLVAEFVEGSVGGSARRDLFAVREDGAGRVRLTSDPTLQVHTSWNWHVEDDAGATVSMLARRFTGPASNDTVVPGTAGLYVAHLSFDGAGQALGFDAEPVFFASVGTTTDNAGRELANAWSYACSPDMTAVAVQNQIAPGVPQQIRVLDVESGSTRFTVPAGAWPDWSPDGRRIAFSRYTDGGSARRSTYAVEAINPDGSGLATLVSARASDVDALEFPKWSPDGAYVAYQHSASFTRWIYRVPASGGAATNLTPEVTPAGGITSAGLYLVDWR